MTVATVPHPPAPLEVALAILYQKDRILMQLRDNIPTIVHPGVWALFGGHLEPGETPEVALRRELEEEISYTASTLAPFGQYADARVIRHVFVGTLDVDRAQLVLKEGWDFDLVPVAAIHEGYHYSVNAQERRPLGRPHQQILLDFLSTQANPELRWA